MTPTDKTEQAELCDLLASAGFGTVFCWRLSPGQWRVEKLAMVGDLPADFGEAATSAARDLHDNRSGSAYNVEGVLADNEFAALDNPRSGASEPPVGGNLFPQLDDFGAAPIYGHPRRRKAAPNLYVVIAQLPNGEQAKFGSRVGARNVLAGGRGIRTLFDEGTFAKLDGTIVSFEREFDWIEWRGVILILNNTSFHITFRDIAEMERAVEAHIDAISERVNILGKDVLIERCRRSPAMMTKLQKVIDQKLYDKPIEQLQAYSQQYPGLGVVWQGDELIYDGALDRQWSILRLFDEAGFTGGLSGEQFLSKSKDPL